VVGIRYGLNHVLSPFLSLAPAISIVATFLGPILDGAIPVAFKRIISLFGSLDSLGEASNSKELVKVVAVYVSNGLWSRRKLVVATPFRDVRFERTFNRISCQIIGGVKAARLEQDTSVSEAVLSQFLEVFSVHSRDFQMYHV
jgi:hypothetical protein